MSFPTLALPQTPSRHAITAAWRRDEGECVRSLLSQADIPAGEMKGIQALAKKLVSDVRHKRTRASGVDALMHEFSLSSQEGVALMCLAEALLRIPDQATADKLIRDKISKGDWGAHLGQSQSLFVNAATWGLVITGKLVNTHNEAGLSHSLSRLIAKGGEPLIRKGVDLAMRMLGKQFVTGETIDEALANGREREARGYRFSYDMLGEAAMTEADAQRYMKDYETAIHAIGKAANGRGIIEGPGISVKLSAIHPRYSRAQRDRALQELLPRLKALFVLAKKYNIGLNIDAEEADRLELSLDLIEAIAHDDELAGWDGIGIVVQAYQKRCPFVIDWLIELARKTGHRFMVRLVKGAYWDAEIKRAQVDGLSGYPVYTRKVYTDVSYIACAKKLLAAQDAIYPQFATHNAYSLSAIWHLGQGKEFEFQCLHGMGETLYDQVVGQDKLNRACRIYAPVGSHETLLAYLVRRLLENGANSSFVNRIVDESVSIDELVADPVAQAKQLAGSPHPRIALPPQLYGAQRLNSNGLDLASEVALNELDQALTEHGHQDWLACPIIAGQPSNHPTALPVLNPAQHSDIVGRVIEAELDDVEHALSAATAAAGRWAATSPIERANVIEAFADQLEAQRSSFLALAVREAGKTFANAVAEVREAVDFCRYYALQIRGGDGIVFSPERTPAVGPVVAISPWNFPLAIFVGEVIAAIAAGNPVLAKPAEQTALIAAHAVRLMHQAGIPHDVVQFLPGRGETVGAALSSDPRVQGVIFTGSTEVAQIISRAVAKHAHDVALIAETGGQNAMIVDSSALPEQVVTDVLSSAFDSAGQRCSALRILCLQEDIADRVITMLKGAMDELRVGNPNRLSTDVGPVIDREAQQQLLGHISQMQRTAKWMYQIALPSECSEGSFIAPTLFEIDSIRELKREVFGPVLHIVRFQSRELPQLIRDINATGYGLTLGIHSRIDETIDLITSTAHVGNIYVNRNIVGAVVGVQPFGGEGLSGTGPKAGGPFYLQRLTRAAQWQAPANLAQTGAQSARLDHLFAALTSAPELQQDKTRLAQWLQTCQQLSLLERDMLLPGPTGERNSLHFAPRGTVSCIADSSRALAMQLIAAFATGNRVRIADNAAAQTLLPRLPDSLGLAIDAFALKAEDVSAVLFSGNQSEAQALRKALAARDGARVPLLLAEEDGQYNLARLVAERAISVNTTAAGGNASLMSLTESA